MAGTMASGSMEGTIASAGMKDLATAAAKNEATIMKLEAALLNLTSVNAATAMMPALVSELQRYTAMLQKMRSDLLDITRRAALMRKKLAERCPHLAAQLPQHS